MNLATVVGPVLAFALIAGAMMIGGGVAPFIDAQSAMIVIGYPLFVRLTLGWLGQAG